MFFIYGWFLFWFWNQMSKLHVETVFVHKSAISNDINLHMPDFLSKKFDLMSDQKRIEGCFMMEKLLTIQNWRKVWKSLGEELMWWHNLPPPARNGIKWSPRIGGEGTVCWNWVLRRHILGIKMQHWNDVNQSLGPEKQKCSPENLVGITHSQITFFYSENPTKIGPKGTYLSATFSKTANLLTERRWYILQGGL